MEIRPNRIVIMRTMSSSSGQNLAGLRKLLQSVLIVPADLDSFCLDYFPDVYRRFGSSSDRDHKLNLLLLLHDAAEIESCLREFDATRVAHFKPGGASVQGPPRLAMGVRLTRIGLVSWGALLLPIALSLSIYVWRLLPPRTRAPSPGGPVAATELVPKVVTVPPPPQPKQALPRAIDAVPVAPIRTPTQIRPPHPPPRKPPEQLSDKEINRVLGKVRFTGCPLPVYSDLVMFDLTIAPDGHVSTALTPELGQDYGCIRARVREATFPKFSGKPMTRNRYPLRVSDSQG